MYCFYILNIFSLHIQWYTDNDETGVLQLVGTTTVPSYTLRAGSIIVLLNEMDKHGTLNFTLLLQYCVVFYTHRRISEIIYYKIPGTYTDNGAFYFIVNKTK